MDKVSVVIPVYGQWHLLKRNIDSLLQFDRCRIAEIIVVNDCSPEPNPYVFDSALVRILDNPQNLGYAGTVNHGLRNACSEILLLLDSDAFCFEPFMERVLSYYRIDKQIGCVGFRTRDEDGNQTGSWQFEPSVLGLIVGQQLEAKLDRMRFRRHANILPYSCTVSFRKACLEDMGYFDAQTFKVLEADNDLGMRIHRSLWKLVFAQDIVLCHKGGNSYKINNKRVQLFHDSRWALLRKHGLIRYPWLSKKMLQARILCEIALLRVLSWKKNGKGYAEKMAGRKILLKSSRHYS